MVSNITLILQKYRVEMENIFGASLVRVILYGSYARGDYNINSDVDIMILADIQPEEVSRFADKVYDVSYNFDTEYNIEINPSVQSIHTFDHWKEVYPFFINIEKEGVVV